MKRLEQAQAIGSVLLKQTSSKQVSKLQPSQTPDSIVERSIPRVREDFTEAVEVWNEAADEAGLPKIQRLTEPRARALKARLAECGGIEGWRAVIGKVRDSPFLRGNNPNGWKADFDFVLQAKSFTKLMEGSYDGHRSKPASPAQKSNLELLYEAVNGPGREIGNEVW